MVEILLQPCEKHRNYQGDCPACRLREREAFWSRQHRLAQEDKRA